MTRRKAFKLTGGAVGVLAAGKIGIEFLNWAERQATPLNYPFPNTADLGNVLPPTPACDRSSGPTRTEIEGPYYKADSPLRNVLRDVSTIGIPLVVEGRVLTTDCRPIAGAVLDVWSCDGNGNYDNEGFHLRGHQFTDNQGSFHIETVKPVPYGNFFGQRSPHLHIKVQGRHTPLLTTQLFLPGEPLNPQDPMFHESLLLKVETSGDNQFRATFDFVLENAKA